MTHRRLTSLDEELATYGARRTTRGGRPLVSECSESHLKTLRVLVPLAATAVLGSDSALAQCNAQFNCTSPIATTSAYGATCAAGMLDADGDGVFDFQIASGSVIALGTGNCVYNPFYVSVFTGQTIATSVGPWVGSGSWSASGTGGIYVGLKLASGKVGFANIVVGGGGQFSVNTPMSGAWPGSATVIGTCAALPVEMGPLALVADERNGSLRLEWTTHSESDNAGFEVLRSTDGASFAKIGWVEGQGSSNRDVDYRFADVDVRSGTEYFYRIRQVDFDGTTTMTEVVSGRIEVPVATVTAFPNPSHGHMTLQVRSPEGSEDFRLDVFDVTGRRVFSHDGTGKAVENVDFDGSALPDGIYYARVVAGKQTAYASLQVAGVR